MKLDLRFSTRSLDDLWCKAIAAFVFRDFKVSTGIVSKINEKMADSLSDLVSKNIFKGERDENCLLASQDMLRSDKVLLYGLGEQKEFNTKILESRVKELSDTLDKLGVNEFGIYIPLVEGKENLYSTHLESSVYQVVDRFYHAHGRDSGYLLKTIFSLEESGSTQK